MRSLKSVLDEIHSISNGRFELGSLNQFILKFQEVLCNEALIDCHIQISTDEGIELEIGFFTETRVADVTLSAGKVYSYAYPILAIRKTALEDLGTKWTLTIAGEKKFDYNIVKPSSNSSLLGFQKSLDSHLAGLRRKAQISLKS